MRKTASSRKKAPITIAAARRAARLVKAKRGGRPFTVTPAFWDRYLGHFGPPVKTAKRKSATKKSGRQAKKVSKKRAA